MDYFSGNHGLDSHRQFSRQSMDHLQSAAPAGDDDKENVTTDVAAIIGRKRSSARLDGCSRRLRSKSLGPGGLDALTQASHNQRKIPSKTPIKSILKPTVPISPPLERFSAGSTRASAAALLSSGRSCGGNGSDKEAQSIDLSGDHGERSRVSITGADILHNPFDATSATQPYQEIAKSASEIQSTVVDEERTEREVRDKQKQVVMERREARRKSMANRRVSFAPEATLHTWNVVEFVQDSTISSASTSSNRRASSMTASSSHVSPASPRAPQPAVFDGAEPPSTPPSGHGAGSNKTPPTKTFVETARNKRRRRSSGSTNISDEDLTGQTSLSSPFSGVSTIDSDNSTSSDTVSVEALNDENGEGDSTSMSLDSIDMTMDSAVSALSSNGSTASTSRLNEALRRAAEQAGTRGIEYDENGDLSMELAEDQVTAAFQSWSKGRMDASNELQDLTSFQDQENQNPFHVQRISAHGSMAIGQDGNAGVESEPTAGVTMEMTRAVGRILPSQMQMQTPNAVFSPGTTDMTMEMTRAVGRILPSQMQVQTSNAVLSPGTTDVTIDMTRAVGRILPSQIMTQIPNTIFSPGLAGPGGSPASARQNDPADESSTLSDATMDLTVMVGGIQDEAEALSEQSSPAEVRVMTEQESNAEEHGEPNSVRSPTEDPQYPSQPDQSLEGFEAGGSAADVGIQKITLRQFLELTNVHFMDLTMTKRRRTGNHSMSAGRPKEDSAESAHKESSQLAARVRAACCTLPMLELYQHSCHELKKYISEGRGIVRRLETETSEETPSLFREYLTAAPDVRFIMDDQFKNTKTHSRLSSKAVWYEWRKKLLDDLKQGLLKIENNMDEDDRVLQRREDMLSSTLPALIEIKERLEQEHAGLRERAEENARVDQAELAAARDQSVALDENVRSKGALLESLQMQIRGTQEAIESVTERMMALEADIVLAENTKEDCRGYNAAEVRRWKDMADHLAKTSGWTIASVHKTVVQMTYQSRLHLGFDVSSFSPSGSRKALDATVWLEESACGASVESAWSRQAADMHNLFVDIINEQLQAFDTAAARPKLKDVLLLVSSLWRRASVVAEEVRCLQLHYPCELLLVMGGTPPPPSREDHSHHRGFAIAASLLLPSLKTKIRVVFDVVFDLQHTQDIARIVSVAPRVSVVYGERFDRRRMQDFLEAHIQRYGGRGRGGGDDTLRKNPAAAAAPAAAPAARWVDAVRGLSKALVTRGRVPA